MRGEEWALAASVLFAGLAAGFLGELCTIHRERHQKERAGAAMALSCVYN